MTTTGVKPSERRILRTIQRLGLLEKMHSSTPNTYGRQRQRAEAEHKKISLSHPIPSQVGPVSPELPGGQVFSPVLKLYEVTTASPTKWAWIAAGTESEARYLASAIFPDQHMQIAFCFPDQARKVSLPEGNLWDRFRSQDTAAVICVIGIDQCG